MWADPIRLTAAVLLTAFAFLVYTPVARPADELPHIATARASVRMWTDGAGSCSVVVVAPGRAYTAAHCEGLVPEGLIDGKRVVSFERIGQTDAAKLLVPGLACPCVPLASEQPNLDDRVFGVGYPHGVMRVLVWGRVQERILVPEAAGFVPASFGCAPGCSGGGVFNKDGRLVGVISAILNGMPMTLYTPIPL